jgi:ribonuclease P protein component
MAVGKRCLVKPFGLPKSQILKTRDEFQKLFHQGVRLKGQTITLFYLYTDTTKIGFAVQKSAGNAVNRNKIKRIMRHLWRTHRQSLSQPAHIVLIGRPVMLKSPFVSMEAEMDRLFKQIG